MRFQQTSGAVMAKGVEDTAIYRDVRLLALNEVGGDPDRFGIGVDEFHRTNQLRLDAWPCALLAATTHDTKRSADVRARIAGALHDGRPVARRRRLVANALRRARGHRGGARRRRGALRAADARGRVAAVAGAVRRVPGQGVPRGETPHGLGRSRRAVGTGRARRVRAGDGRSALRRGVRAVRRSTCASAPIASRSGRSCCAARSRAYPTSTRATSCGTTCSSTPTTADRSTGRCGSCCSPISCRAPRWTGSPPSCSRCAPCSPFVRASAASPGTTIDRSTRPTTCARSHAATTWSRSSPSAQPPPSCDRAKQQRQVGSTCSPPSMRSTALVAPGCSCGRLTSAVLRQWRMLTARAITRIAIISDTNDWTSIVSFAQCLIGMTSVGLNASAFVNDEVEVVDVLRSPLHGCGRPVLHLREEERRGHRDVVMAPCVRATPVEEPVPEREHDHVGEPDRTTGAQERARRRGCPRCSRGRSRAARRRSRSRG